MKWEESDLDIVNKCCNIKTFDELEELIGNGSFIKVAEAGDYKRAYEDYLENNPDKSDWITFETFMEEINLGYGHLGMLEIAKLIVLSNGIYYDNDYWQ